VTRRAALLALALALSTSTATAQTPAGLVTVRCASNAADDLTPVLYAQRAGLFARAGLNVELTRMNSGAAVSAGVLGGSLDIGKSSLLPIITAHARGLPLVLVAPGELWLTNAPISGLVVLKTSSITSGKDLNGKNVAVVALKDLTDTGTRAWVDQHGGDSTTLHMVELPSSSALAALTEGRVDAANISNPFFSNVVASGKVRVIGHPDDAIAKRFLITGWFATSDYVRKNRSVVERFAQVVRQAAAYTNKHHAETVEMIASFSGMDPAVIGSMTRATVADGIDPRDIQPLIDTAAKYKVIDRAFDARELIGLSGAKGS
jgi:NitT/TauT family transport system substrate-binding protein